VKLLAIDTATEACSAAVWINDLVKLHQVPLRLRGEGISHEPLPARPSILQDDGLIERYQWAPREHNRLILPMIEELLAEAGLKPAELDAIAFGRGPGSFTGLRIAAGVTQGIALGLDLPVIPVSTLAALALDAMLDQQIDRAFACIDARMSEVYWGVYRLDASGEPRLEGREMVCPATEVMVREGQPGAGIGSGWGTYRDPLSQRVGAALRSILPDRFPRAGRVARLAAFRYARGETVPAELALPVYLRDQVARKPGDPVG